MLFIPIPGMYKHCLLWADAIFWGRKTKRSEKSYWLVPQCLIIIVIIISHHQHLHFHIKRHKWLGINNRYDVEFRRSLRNEPFFSWPHVQCRQQIPLKIQSLSHGKTYLKCTFTSTKFYKEVHIDSPVFRPFNYILRLWNQLSSLACHIAVRSLFL